MKNIILAVIIMAVMMGVTSEACECQYMDVQKQYDQANLVFWGTVIQVMTTEAVAPDPDYLEATFKIEKPIKGFDEALPEEISVRTVFQGKTCGVPFMKDKRYIIYANQLEENGLWMTDICSGTKSEEEYLNGMELEKQK